MAKYKITLTFEGSNVKTVANKVKQMFGDDAAASVTKIVNPSSRADRLSEIETMFEDGKSEVESLRDELQEWLDNLPENLQGSDKASQLEDAISGLEDIISNMESVDFNGVEFPGMF